MLRSIWHRFLWNFTMLKMPRKNRSFFGRPFLAPGNPRTIHGKTPLFPVWMDQRLKKPLFPLFRGFVRNEAKRGENGRKARKRAKSEKEGEKRSFRAKPQNHEISGIFHFFGAQRAKTREKPLFLARQKRGQKDPKKGCRFPVDERSLGLSEMIFRGLKKRVFLPKNPFFLPRSRENRFSCSRHRKSLFSPSFACFARNCRKEVFSWSFMRFPEKRSFRTKTPFFLLSWGGAL